MGDNTATKGLGEEERFYGRNGPKISSAGAVPLLLIMALTIFSDKEVMTQTTQEFTSTIGELQTMLDSMKQTLTALEQAANAWNSFEARYR